MGETIKRSLVVLVFVVCIVVAVVAASFLLLRNPSEGGVPSFAISVSPKSLSLARGGSENLTINFQPAQLPSNLGHEVQGLPAGVQYSGTPGSFTPPSPPTTFVLTFSAADNAATGSYLVTVVCADIDRSLTSSDNFTLTVT